MQQFLMTTKRAKLLEDPALLDSVSERLACRIEVRGGNEVVISGEAYDEYNAKNVLQAFGRGFDINKAYKLLSEDYFFESVDLKVMFKNEDRVRRIKARIIGSEGRAKSYMQTVSGADMVVYGDTVSMIGTIDELRILRSALNVLLDGGTHKKAYTIMEKLRKRIVKGDVFGAR
jgi:ribosomal RNA assembly protein